MSEGNRIASEPLLQRFRAEALEMGEFEVVEAMDDLIFDARSEAAVADAHKRTGVPSLPDEALGAALDWMN